MHYLNIEDYYQLGLSETSDDESVVNIVDPKQLGELILQKLEKLRKLLLLEAFNQFVWWEC